MTKYLSLSWFKSKIDKVVDATVEKVVNQKVEKLAEQRIEELQQLDVEEIPQVNEFANVSPVIYKINDVVTVILPSSGKTFTKEGMSKEEFEKLNSLTETGLIEYFSSPEIKKEIEQVKQIQKENEIVQSNFETLRASGEFEIKDDSVYMKGINRSIPKLLVNKFTEVIENAGVDSVNYLSLKNFWLWACLNPRAEVADSLFDYLERNNMKITKQGFFIGLRNVKTVEGVNHHLIDFISNAYHKVKAVWKKSAKQFKIVTIPDSNKYELKTFSFNVEGTDYICLGDLEFLYLNLPSMSENRYTDGWTSTFDIRIGQVVKMNPEDCDWSTQDCATAGLHFAGHTSPYVLYGNTTVFTLHNPMKVVGIGVEKGRCWEYLPFMTTTVEEADEIMTSGDFDFLELDEQYAIDELKDLENKVKQGFAVEAKKYSFNIPQISTSEIKNIITSLEQIKTKIANRVVKMN